MADQKTIDYYDSNATFYGNVVPDPLGEFVAYRKRFMRRLKPGGRVLDLGCGGGHAAVAFIENGFDVTAVDGSVGLASIASQRTNTDVVVKDFSELDFQSEFDGIWAAASLTHVSLDSLDDVLERVCMALRPEGLLFASFKCSDVDWRDEKDRFYSAINAIALGQFARKAGFDVELVEEVEGQGCFRDPTTWAWLIAGRSV